MKQNALSSFWAAKPAAATPEGSPAISDDVVLEQSSTTDEAPEGASHSRLSPASKKQKIQLHRPRGKEPHRFQQAWCERREWLKFDAAVGMWCEVCHAFRQHPSVIGKGQKQNALANPTKHYSFRNVKGHADTGYHLAATGLRSKFDSPLSTAAILLPVHIIPQAKLLFRTVLYMAQHGIAHRNLTSLLALQKQNGVKYDLRYGSHYTPVVMQFLAKAAREFFHSCWVSSATRAVMTDEVKQAGRQWVSITARLFFKNAFHQAVAAVVELPGEGRNADAISASLKEGFATQGVHAWLDDCLVALCVDGASVLLSGVHSHVKQQAPNALKFYCASHRTQRVDFEVTAVPKAEQGDEVAMAVRRLARHLDSILAKTSRFFSVSTKRWAALRAVARDLGYHVHHGPIRQRSRDTMPKRLLKFKRVQKTRYIHWKRWAAHVWLNNLPALQKYLREAQLPPEQKKKAERLLKRCEDACIIGGMVVYERWAAVLTTLSLATQATWAVLPILAHTVRSAQERIAALPNVLENFILQCDLAKASYKSVTLRGSKADLETLAKWTNLLKDRTLEKVLLRFPVQEGGLFWAASLFDHRTWPLTDMQFSMDIVSGKLHAIQQLFPAATNLVLNATQFVALSRALTVQLPPQRSHSGRVVGRDAVAAWVFAASRLQTKEWDPLIHCAIALCTVPLSQTSCEQLNRVATCLPRIVQSMCQEATRLQLSCQACL